MVVYKDLIFFLDRTQHKIIWFDKQGHYINSLDKIGKGPDEYLDICGFDINKNNGNIETTDARTFRVYNQDCELIERKAICAKTGKFLHEFSRIDDDKMAFIDRAKESSEGYIYSLSKEKILKVQEDLYPGLEILNIDNQGFIQHTSESDYVITYRGALTLSIDEDGFHLCSDFDFGESQLDYNNPQVVASFLKLTNRKERIKWNRDLRKKYNQQFQNHYENDLFIIKGFYAKDKGKVGLIYNKKSKSYKLFSGFWGGVFLSQNMYLEKNILTLYLTNSQFERLPLETLNSQVVSVLEKHNINDNPIVFRFKLKN